MTAALLYRPRQRWQICLAFGCAAGLHLAAIALARSEPEIETTSFLQSTDSGVDVIIDPTADQTPVQPMEPTPPEPSEFVKPDETFAEEGSTPALISARKRKPVFPLVKSASIAGVSGVSFGSVKVLATYAPRPEYPYEARRQRTTGSGLVILMIDSSTGSVINARMAQSTGSAVLDNSAVSALRTWRFKSGMVAKVQVPITYTLSGASY
jgi:TonB family protein